MRERPHPRATIRTALAALVVAVALGGCAPTRPIAAADAVEHYDRVGHDVLAAMDTVRPLHWEQRRPGVRTSKDGTCIYDVGVWTADDELYPVPGQGMDWDPWRAAIDPVLEEHGFSKLGRERRAGSELRVESTDEHGALLRIGAGGSLMIAGVEVDADPCEGATLGL